MKIIISPAKNMRVCDDLPYKNLPVFINKAEILKKELQELSFKDLQKLLCCNEKIALTAYTRFKNMDLKGNLSPAILSYDGIQYKYMAPHIFSDKYFDYVEKNLRIMSGFYGILKPFDGIVPHRLEMQAKFNTPLHNNLYDFWGDEIYKELTSSDKTIIDLTSKEYRKIIEKYLSKNIKFITCVFGEFVDGKIIEKGVYVKMARGEMVRFMAENSIEDYNDIKKFDRLGYKFQKELSNENKFVFIKRPAK